MDDNSLTKKIFWERAEVYFSDDNIGIENGSKSIVFDLLDVCALFGILDEVKGMVEAQRFYPKSVWREMVWKRGWALEDHYWRIEKHLHKSLMTGYGHTELFKVTCYNFQPSRAC